MSMQTYPFEEKCAFVFDHVAAATILIADYFKNSPEALCEALRERLENKAMTPYQAARSQEFNGWLTDNDFFNVSDAYDILEGAGVDGLVHCSEFQGDACTAPEFSEYGLMTMSYDDDYVAFLTPANESSLFRPAYETHAALLDEYKAKLIPFLGEDFSYGARIMDVHGTYFC